MIEILPGPFFHRLNSHTKNLKIKRLIPALRPGEKLVLLFLNNPTELIEVLWTVNELGIYW
jgi:hypothetical protein